MQRYVALHGAKTYGPAGYGTLSKYTTQKEPTFIRGVSKLMLHTSGYCYCLLLFGPIETEIII